MNNLTVRQLLKYQPRNFRLGSVPFVPYRQYLDQIHDPHLISFYLVRGIYEANDQAGDSGMFGIKIMEYNKVLAVRLVFYFHGEEEPQWFDFPNHQKIDETNTLQEIIMTMLDDIPVSKEGIIELKEMISG